VTESGSPLILIGWKQIADCSDPYFSHPIRTVWALLRTRALNPRVPVSSRTLHLTTIG